MDYTSLNILLRVHIIILSNLMPAWLSFNMQILTSAPLTMEGVTTTAATPSVAFSAVA